MEATVMRHLSITIKQFICNDDGVTAIEYGLIASLIGVAIITGVSAVGTNMNSMFSYIATMVT